MTKVIDSETDNIPLQARLGLLIVAPLSGLAQSGLSPILPKISEHFAGEPQADVLVRLLVSSVTFAMIFGSIAGGMVADRLGQRKTLLWSLVGYAIAGTAGFFIDDLRALVVSRFFLGVFNAAIGVIAAAIITTRIAAEYRNKWLGFFSMTATFGAIVILLLVGVVGGHDWRSVFLFHLSAIPVVLAMAVMLPRDREVPHVAREIVRGRFPVVLVLFGVAIGAVAATSTIFVPYHLAHIGKIDPKQVAAALIPTAIAAGVFSSGYGWVRKHVGIIPVFLIGFVIAAAGTLVVALTPTFAGTAAGMAMFGAAVGMIGPNLFAAAAAASSPERRAQTIGVVRAGFYSGPLLAQLSLEPLSHIYGATSSLLALASFGLFMVVATLLGRRVLSPIA